MCKDEIALLLFSFSSLKKTKSFRSWVIFSIILLWIGIHSIEVGSLILPISNPIVLTANRNPLLFKSYLRWNLAPDWNLVGNRNLDSAATSFNWAWQCRHFLQLSLHCQVWNWAYTVNVNPEMTLWSLKCHRPLNLLLLFKFEMF